MPKDHTDYRFLYAQEQIRAQRTYDKTLLTLSSGSFAISFAFIDKFISGAPTLTTTIILAWLCLSICIILQISSHLVSYHAFKQAIENYGHVAEGDDANPGGKYSRYVDYLNYSSAFTFALGMLGIILFVYFNFS